MSVQIYYWAKMISGVRFSLWCIHILVKKIYQIISLSIMITSLNFPNYAQLSMKLIKLSTKYLWTLDIFRIKATGWSPMPTIVISRFRIYCRRVQKRTYTVEKNVLNLILHHDFKSITSSNWSFSIWSSCQTHQIYQNGFVT